MKLGSEKTIDSAELRRALGRVLQSAVFQRAQRSQHFLSYLVEATLADPPAAVKEYSVAIDVFDRGNTYNPSVDATVRVEASRLRSRLREYYAEEGRGDPWVIEVPKGSYSIVFTPRVPAESAGNAESPARTTPPPNNIRSRLWISTLVLMIVVAATTLAWHFGRAGASSAASPDLISLAILPVANQTGDQSLNYVADGFTDDLIRQLSQIPALRLVGHTTVFRYRNRASDAEAIAQALHVNTVMTGALRRTPEHTSLVVEVTNAADGTVVLDREYIADARDLPSVQADLQRDLLAKLHLETSARNPSRHLPSVTSNAVAYQEFLKSDALERDVAPANFHQAIAHLEKAVALDPQFDLAWASLANAHVFLGLYFEPPREQIPVARQCAQRALERNPSLGEAHGSLGLIHLIYDWDLPAAQAEMSMAGAQAAAIGTLACTAHLIAGTGKPRAAEEMLQRLLTYDPQSSGLTAELGCVDFYRGDYEAALRHYRDALRFDPQTPVAYWGMGKTLNAQGKHAEAIEALRSFKDHNGFEPPLLTAEIGYALGASGQRRAAMDVIHHLSATPGSGFIDPYLIAVVYLSMNDRDAAFRWLNKALDLRSSFAISILKEPKWQPIRNDPRFAQAIERMLANKA